MCRWLAFMGCKNLIDNLLFHTSHSLINQSLHAEESITIVNGDGCGLAWYQPEFKTPCLYRDVHPAWQDHNLRSLAQHHYSHLFFAHIRAATDQNISRNNSHPFSYQQYLFQHNGMIGHWQILRQKAEAMIKPELFPYRLGSTDSEVIFLYIIAYVQKGLSMEDAFKHSLNDIMMLRKSMQCEEKPVRISMALSDGEKIWAVRWSSDFQAPSLYFGDHDSLKNQLRLKQCHHSYLIVSEPLDHVSSWQKIDQNMMLYCDGEQMHITAFDL
jgi:predicted glutamine amidotransferase